MIRHLTQVRSSLPAWTQWLLPIVPLIVLTVLYLHCANARRQENPGDKLLPLPSDLGRAAVVAFSRDEFTEKVPMVEDLRASLAIYGVGFGAAVGVALVLGLHIGTWSWAHGMFDPILRFFSYLPPLALLPLVMLFLGIGDLAKTFLIFISVVVPLTRSLVLRVQAVDEREIWNAMTLGTSTPELIWIVFRRLTEPGFLDDIRLLIGTAWVYLIAAELIASNAGLGYRISVAGRNLNVAQIFLYIAVICLLAFAMDRAIHHFNRWRNRWAFA
jgi:NitT/TauT family transport system permease protein